MDANVALVHAEAAAGATVTFVAPSSEISYPASRWHVLTTLAKELPRGPGAAARARATGIGTTGDATNSCARQVDLLALLVGGERRHDALENPHVPRSLARSAAHSSSCRARCICPVGRAFDRRRAGCPMRVDHCRGSRADACSSSSARSGGRVRECSARAMSSAARLGEGGAAGDCAAAPCGVRTARIVTRGSRVVRIFFCLRALPASSCRAE